MGEREMCFKVFDGATGQRVFERGYEDENGNWVKDETFEPERVMIDGKPYLSVSIPSPKVWDIGEDGKPYWIATGEPIYG